MKQRRFDGHTLAAIALVAIWALSLVPFVSAGAGNTRLVEAFSVDEALQANLISRALRSHSLKLVFGSYGHFYLNLTLLPLTMLWPVTDRVIVEFARSLSVLCGAALLLFTAWWTRREVGIAAAWLALLLLGLNQTLYTFAGMVHPDILQALLLMVALFYTTRAVEQPTTFNVLAASAAAGLAFATKYSGMFVLPLIAVAIVGRHAIGGGPRADLRLMVARSVLAVASLVLLGAFAIEADWIVRNITSDGRVDVPLLISLQSLVWLIRGTAVLLTIAVATPWLWDGLRRWKGLATTLWGFGVALATFVTVFAIGSPFSFWKLAFLKGMYYEAMETGAKMNARWVEDWVSAGFSAIGWPIVVPATCTTIWLLTSRHRRRLTALQGVLLGWTAIYGLVLLAPVHEIFLHYTLPIIAPAAILAGHGIVTACDAIGSRLMRQRAALAITFAVVLSCQGPAAAALLANRAGSLRREEAIRVRVGNWVADHIPASSHVAYDYFSYVPPKFARVAGTWGGSRAWLASVDPDLVIVNGRTAEAWRGHPDEEAYYQCLENGTCGYGRVFALEHMAVYKRDAPPGAGP